MRAVVQRVSEARVRVDGEVVGEIGQGLCVLLGVSREDGEDEAARLADKVAKLRIFENEHGKFDRSLLDTSGAALVISQFTLIADSKQQRGTRPSFTHAAKPEQAESLYEAFIGAMRDEGIEVQSGRFGAYMQLELVNDGPVTIVLG